MSEYGREPETAFLDDEDEHQPPELIVANNVEAEAEVVIDQDSAGDDASDADDDDQAGTGGEAAEHSNASSSGGDSDSSSSSSGSDGSSSSSSSDSSSEDEQQQNDGAMKEAEAKAEPAATAAATGDDFEQQEESDDEDQEHEISQEPMRKEKTPPRSDQSLILKLKQSQFPSPPPPPPPPPPPMVMKKEKPPPEPKQHQKNKSPAPRSVIPATMLQMTNMFDDPVAIEQNCDENGVYKWDDFIGAKVRTFSQQEYQLYQEPFRQGWKRELVIRCTGARPDKKLGDVYYHTPDSSTKIRSFVEMSQFLKKNPQIDLSVNNFSYAKQPIWRPPNEIVRHAMQRGANHSGERFTSFRSSRQQQRPSPSVMPSRADLEYDAGPTTMLSHTSATLSGNEDSNDPYMSQHGGILGRGKRKRVMPSRYEDNDIDLIPMKKGKPIPGVNGQQDRSGQINQQRESYSNGNSNDGHSPQSTKSATGSMSKMSAQERRIVLQRQLYQQVTEEMKREEEKAKAAAAVVAATSTPDLASAEPANGSSSSMAPQTSLKMKIFKSTNGNRKGESKRPADSASGEGQSMLMRPATTKVELGPEEMNDSDFDVNDVGATNGAGNGNETMRQPCNTNCPGRRNMLPNLMCYRCFCLFHLDCVPDGVFLKNPKAFICPNCLMPEDRFNAEDSPDVKSESVPPTTKNHGSNKSRNKVSGENSILPPSDPNSLLAKHNTHPVAPTSQKKKSSKKRQQNKTEESLLNGNMANGFSEIANTKTSSDGPGDKIPYSPKPNGTTIPYIYKSALSRRIVPPHPLSQQQQSSSKRLYSPSSPTSSNLLNFYSNNVSNNHQAYRYSYGHHPDVTKFNNKKNTTSLTSLMMNGGGGGEMPPEVGQNRNQNRYKNNNHFEPDTVDKMQQLLKNASKMYQERKTLVKTTAQQLAGRPSTLMNNNIDGGKAVLATDAMIKQPVNKSSKWYKYQSKMFSARQLSSMVDVWIKIIQYLDLKDIIKMRLVCRQWYQMASVPAAWIELRLNGCFISDLQHFFYKVIQDKCVKSLDFVGIIDRQQEMANDFWKQLEIMLPDMSQIESMKFGTVPLSVIDHIPSQLYHLTLKNLFDEAKSENKNEPCRLDFFRKFDTLERIQSLHIDSANGFVLDEATESRRAEQFQLICATVKRLTSQQLHTFTCRSFQDLTRDEYAQLIGNFDAEKMRKLSLGSCSKWFDEPCDLLFDNLGKLSNLWTLKLRDVNLVATSMPLVNLFETLIVVESFALENLTIDSSAKLVWESLSAMLRSLPLRELCFTSADSFSNRHIFETLIQLLFTQKRSIQMSWSVTVKIDNLGQCYVPFSFKPFQSPEENPEDQDDQQAAVKREPPPTPTPGYLEKELAKNRLDLQYEISEDQTILVEIDSLNQWIGKKIRAMAKKNPMIKSEIKIFPL